MEILFDGPRPLYQYRFPPRREAIGPLKTKRSEQSGALCPDHDRPKLLRQAEPPTQSILCSSAKGCQRKQSSLTELSGLRIPDRHGRRSRERSECQLGRTTHYFI